MVTTDSERSYLRLVREPAPLGAYVRPLERDYRYVARLLSSGFPVGTGVVVDACHLDRSSDLRAEARDQRLETVLDPKSIELSTVAGITRSGVLDLPWSVGAMDAPDQFDDRRITEYTESLAKTALQMGVDAVLAPSHYLESIPSPWLERDVALTAALREKLDSSSAGKGVRVYYPLASNLRAFASDAAVKRVVKTLSDLARSGAANGVWLRMHAFGTNTAGALTLPRYLRLARSLHEIGLPVVAEKTGTVGLALLAFGAVVGVESGITHGERYDHRTLMKKPRGPQRGGLAPRVYLPPIGVFLPRKAATTLLNTRGIRGTFGCQLLCCRRGIEDMLADPRRHFLVSRSHEVEALARVPGALRVEHYFSNWLRHAADRATRVAQVLPQVEKHRKRLDVWRATLSEQRDRDQAAPPSVCPPLYGESDEGRDVSGS